MTLDARLDELISAAEAAGISIRREQLGGEGGGLCSLRGRRVLFIDILSDAETRYERTLSALAPLTELDGRFLRPDVREDLERVRKDQSEGAPGFNPATHSSSNASGERANGGQHS